MNTRAWPFLVSRNKIVDYTTVVAPQFISNQGISNLLAEAAGGKIDEANNGTYREIHGSKAGDLTLVFHVIQAEKRHIGLEGNEPLRDQSGRPIRLIEGMVFRGLMPDIEVTNKDIQIAHSMVEDAYKEFWNSAGSSSTEMASQFFQLQSNDLISEHLTLRKEQPLTIRQREKELSRKEEFDANKPPRPRRGLIVTLSITGVALVAGAGVFINYLINPPLPPPSSNLSTFCTALAKTNYQSAYALLSDRVQHLSSEQTFAAYFQNPVTSCIYTVTGQSGSAATATLTLKYQGESTSHQINLNLVFVTNKDSWQIDSNFFT